MSTERVIAAANAISESSGMRFDGFWSRVEDLEPEDREYALAEATAAVAAADAIDAAHGIHRISVKQLQHFAHILMNGELADALDVLDAVARGDMSAIQAGQS